MLSEFTPHHMAKQQQNQDFRPTSASGVLNFPQCHCSAFHKHMIRKPKLWIRTLLLPQISGVNDLGGASCSEAAADVAGSRWRFWFGVCFYPVEWPWIHYVAMDGLELLLLLTLSPKQWGYKCMPSHPEHKGLGTVHRRQTLATELHPQLSVVFCFVFSLKNKSCLYNWQVCDQFCI